MRSEVACAPSSIETNVAVLINQVRAGAEPTERTSQCTLEQRIAVPLTHSSTADSQTCGDLVRFSRRAGYGRLRKQSNSCAIGRRSLSTKAKQQRLRAGIGAYNGRHMSMSISMFHTRIGLSSTLS
eukprot:1057646-Prymnesium_polylepis.1